MKIGKWTITHNRKPIPMRDFDYDCVHDDYAGEGCDLQFSAGSIKEVKAEIVDRHYEKLILLFEGRE